MNAEIEKLFFAIDEEIVQLFYRWKIFSQLFGNGMENLKILNQSGSNVFALLQTLVIENVYLTLSRLTDPEKTGAHQNLSIRNLVGKLESELSEKLRKDLTTKLAKLDALCKNLRKYKNKRISHLDLGQAIKAKSLPPVTYGELEDALGLVRAIMQELWLELFDSSVYYEPDIDYGCDGDYLLQTLRKAHGPSVTDV